MANETEALEARILEAEKLYEDAVNKRKSSIYVHWSIFDTSKQVKE